MSNIQNEIVKFIADIEIDPQDAATYQKALGDCEASADALRKSIAQTVEKMAKLREEGKESTAEFAAHKKSLEADTKALKEVTKSADKYAEALGLGSMSLSQLQKHAKNTRAALSKIHKEANPQLWKKYNDELEATNKRIKEIKDNGGKAGKSLEGMAKIAGGITAGGIALKAIGGLTNIAKKGFQDWREETQVVGDQFNMTMTVINDQWSHFLRKLTAGRNEITLSYKEVAQLSREIVMLSDELFELENSYKITASATTQQMNEANAIMRDSSKSAEERMAALTKMQEAEATLAQDRLLIAQQAEDVAYLAFKKQTALEREEAEYFVSNYIQAKKDGLVDLATAYNKHLEAKTAAEEALKAPGQNVGFYQEQRQKLNEATTAMAGFTDEVIRYAEITRQYNLGNDPVTTAFVDAVATRIQAVADADPAALASKYSKLTGTITKQMEAEEKAAREERYRNRIAAADTAYKKELLALKESLVAREISEAEYRVKSEAAELAMLNNKIAINKAFGKDVVDLQNTIADKQIAAQKRITDALAKGEAEFQRTLERMQAEQDREIEKMMDAMMAETEAEIEALLASDPDNPINRLTALATKAQQDPAATKKGKLAQAENAYNTELTDLEDMHSMMLISEEEFLARKQQLNEDYAKAVAQINLETWEESFTVANQFLDAASEMVGSIRDAEMANLDAQMEKELAAAGNNAEERERIEAEYEAKKLDTQKKYADIDMAINIAKTIAAGALAAIQSFAQLGPIAGGVMAGVIAVTTAAQVATIVAQRNAIKNSSVSSSSSGSSGSSGQTYTREVTGYSEGGYTGQGGRLEPAGIVHRGEYVVAAPELRDPEVAREVARIERKRQARLSGRRTLPGYADGGYTGISTSAETDILQQIYEILIRISNTPIPAYIVLSQLQAKQAEWEKYKKSISLKG